MGEEMRQFAAGIEKTVKEVAAEIEDYDKAALLATSLGFRLQRRKVTYDRSTGNGTGRRYQLRGCGWLYNLYTGTYKIYADESSGTPRLRLESPWTLSDVVEAVSKLAAQGR